MINKVKYNPGRTETAGRTDCTYKGNWTIYYSNEGSGGGPSEETGIYAGTDAYKHEGYFNIYTPHKVFQANGIEELEAYLQQYYDMDHQMHYNKLLQAAQEDDDVLILGYHNHGSFTTEGLVVNLDFQEEAVIRDHIPAVNLATSTPQQTGWSGGYTYANGDDTFVCNISNFHTPTGNTGAGWRSWLWPIGSMVNVGETVSITIRFKRVLEHNGTFAWLQTGMTRTDGNGYLGYAPADRKVVISNNTEQVVTWTGTVLDARERIGFTLWINDGRAGDPVEMHIQNVQIEVGEPTPFTRGVDYEREHVGMAKGTSIYNHGLTLRNGPELITTNSEAGPFRYLSFDGVDDYATFDTEYSFDTSNGTDFTFELLFKMRTLPVGEYGKNGHIWGGENGNDLVMYLTPDNGDGSQGLMVFDDSRYNESMRTNTKFQADTWYHWVIVGNGTNDSLTMYVNGTYDGQMNVQASQINRSWSGTRFAYDTRWGTFSELDLAVARQYNRQLTPAEVALNFKGIEKRIK